MKEIQYFDVILDGILNHESYLKYYIIRKQKEAENNNFVSEMEFFQKCRDTVDLIENKIEAQHLKKKRELQETVKLLKSENKPFEKEIKLIDNLSLDRFNISIATITNGKQTGTLWYSQINLIKKCIKEIHNQNFKISTEIKDLDIDNYVNFVFSEKSISRETNKKRVLNSMEKSNQEKTISNYRIWIDYVFNQQNYWEELTEEDKKSFKELRTKSLLEMNDLFESFIKGSPKPRVKLEKEFEIAIINRLSEEPFIETTANFMEGLLPKDLNKLAIVIGKLDFIKKSHKPKVIEVIEEARKKELTLSAIALKCYYEGKILNRENAIKELEGTEHNSSDKLYAHFSKWSNNTDRRAYPESKLKLKNKIELFEKVIESLSLTNRANAIKDLNILKEYLTKY